MKRLLSVLLFFFLMGCDDKTNVDYHKTEYELDNNGKLSVVVLDSCEYYYRPFYHNYMFTHKGNCKNPIHKCNH